MFVSWQIVSSKVSMVEEVKMATSGLSVWNKSDTGLKQLPGRSACTVQFGFTEFDIQFATIVKTVFL